MFFFLNAQAKPWTKAGSVKTEKALSEPLTVSFFRGWHLIDIWSLCYQAVILLSCCWLWSVVNVINKGLCLNYRRNMAVTPLKVTWNVFIYNGRTSGLQSVISQKLSRSGLWYFIHIFCSLKEKVPNKVIIWILHRYPA